MNLNQIILERENLRIIVEKYEHYYSEKIELKDGDKWIPILANNINYSTLNVWTKLAVYSKYLSFKKRTNKKLYYELNDEDFKLDLDYCLEEQNILHIRYKLSNNRSLALSKIAVNYAILLGNKPDFTWVPHFRHKRDYIIGDHVFRSPVIIYKKGKYAFAFVPDLKTLSQNRPFQTFLDFTLKSDFFEKYPQLSYGFGNYIPSGHIYFKHDSKFEWKIKVKTDLTFRYYIIFFNDKSVQEILEFINSFFWEKYGRKLLYENLNPQILPYDLNVLEGFKAILDRHNFWGDFKLNNTECGGFWQKSLIGKNKDQIKFMKSENLHQLTEYFTGVQRLAQIWNNAWFLNIRSGYGFRYFGEFWSEKGLIEKGLKMLNTVLNLPRMNGIFPSVIFPESYNTDKFSTVNGLKAFIYTDDFHIVDACLAMYWCLKFYQDFGEQKQIILEKSSELIELIAKIQLDNGAIPTYINFKDGSKGLIINEDLINSASSGAPMMFLLEYHKINNDSRVIPICKKIAEYIKSEIIPKNKWHDFEAFYACKQIPIDFYDEYTNSNVMNTLCMHWCAEGFKELYKITNNYEYLELGKRILAVLSLFQQVWNLPYISINTFGGFGVQNADAELNDARQALFARTYMEYYLITGKKEYMERGIAALRASWALQILKEYENICPGNLKDIDTINDIDRGCVAENYGHLGKDERISGYIYFDWGVGTAASTTAYAKKHFGDLFIDFKEKFAFGIDGIKINWFDFQDNIVDLKFDLIPNKKYILFKGRDSPEKGIEIIINDKSLGLIKKIDLDNGFQYNLI